MSGNPINPMEAWIKESARVSQKMLKGFENMMHIEDLESGVTPRKLVFTEDKISLYHYEPPGKNVIKIPLVVVYALVNRQYMMDIQHDRSLFRKMLEMGVDLYVIDWGYPSKIDRYNTMSDYILGYMDNVINYVRETTGNDKLNLLGVCQGGTFSIIYSALFPEKINTLTVMVAPVDFHTEDGLLNVWSKFMDVDLMVDVMGNIPGDFMNLGFLWLKPFQLLIDKYVGLMDNIDDPYVAHNFLRMEKWIFDSPDQAGEAFRKFIKDMYQENKLANGTFTLGGRKVDLKNITMPVLNIFGEQDHLVPPSCSKPLSKLVGSKDVTTKPFNLGHIGMYVSGRSQKELAPTVAEWLMQRSGGKNIDEGQKKKSAAKGPGKKASKKRAGK